MNRRDKTGSVSVIIPAFNAAGTLDRAVQSACIQENVLEILLINDGSMDSTAAVAAQIARSNPLVRLLQHGSNKGVSAARNTGLHNAKAKYVAFLDADDAWLYGKIQKQIERIEADAEVTLVTCDSYQLASSGVILRRSHQKRLPVEGNSAWKTLLEYNFIPTPTVLAKRKDIVDVGAFSEELVVAEDLDLWIRLACRGKVAVVGEVLAQYYDYAGSLMKREGWRSETLIMGMLDKHILAVGDRLNGKEINHIIGVRNFNFGLDRYFSGDHSGSMPFFRSAIARRHKVLKSSIFLFRAFMKNILPSATG